MKNDILINEAVIVLTFSFVTCSYSLWLPWGVLRHLNWNTDNYKDLATCLLFFISYSHTVMCHDDDALTQWKLCRILVWICCLHACYLFQVTVSFLHRYIYISCELFLQLLQVNPMELKVLFLDVLDKYMLPRDHKSTLWNQRCYI